MNRAAQYTSRLAKSLPVLLLVFGLFAPGANSAEPTTPASRVDALLTPLVAAHEFTGAVVLERNGQVVYQAGFGMANREAGLEFTPDTPSDGGSLAKTFTAAGLQWLAYEGRVDLDAPVTRYLPQYPHAQTTVQQLVSHSNGLPPYYEFFDSYFTADEVRTTEAMLEVIADAVPQPAFEPGSRFEYSNFAFDLAALVIEKVTGQGYEAFMAERFFTPLGMDSSFARPARFSDWQGVRTMGYRWQDKDWQLVDVFDMEGFLGASNLYFSALDLSRWGSANAAGTALPAPVFERGMQRAEIAGQPSPINGLSWYCSADGERCYYSGDINAFHGFVYWDKARLESVSFVSNSSLPFWPMLSLQRQLVAALAGQTGRLEEMPDIIRPDAQELPMLVGEYAMEGQPEVQVSSGKDGLLFRIGRGLELAAFHVSPGIFYVPGTDACVVFSGGLPPKTLHLRSMFLELDIPRSPAP